MKSHELAKKLLEMADCEVTVSGYEGGVNIVDSVSEPKELMLNVHNAWYYGSHEYKEEYNQDDSKELIQAIHIG